MRGFSISERQLPCIVLNSHDALNGKIFTLIHEFSHILLHNGGICDLENYRNPLNENQMIETFCNYIAGATLVPANALLANSLVRQKERAWSETDLNNLASIFSVSQEVILRRLLTLGRTTEEFYIQKREEFLRIYAEQESKIEGFPPYYRMVINILSNNKSCQL